MVRMNQTSQPSQEEVDTLKKDINDFVEWHVKHGPHPASVVALQELTRLLLPHVPLATRSVFTRNLTQPVVPINDIAEWQINTGGTDQSGDHQDDGDLERGERTTRCRLATLYRLAGRFGLFSLPNGAFSATARVGGIKTHGGSAEESRFLVSPCGVLPHEVTAGAFAKVQVQLETDSFHSVNLRVIADGNTSMFAPRATATFHAAFYCAAPQVRVVCELRTTQTRAIAATRRGLALTAEASQLGKIEFLEYEEAVPDAMRHAAQRTAQEELAKQLHQISERHGSAERELTAARAQLDELVAQREELALKVMVKKPKKNKHRHEQQVADDIHQDAPKTDEVEAEPTAEKLETERQSEEVEKLTEAEAEAEVEAEAEAEAEQPAKVEAEAEAEQPAKVEAEAEAEQPAKDEAEVEKLHERADETETKANEPAEPEGETEKPAEPDIEKPSEDQPEEVETEAEAEKHGETEEREASESESESESEEERDEEAARRVAELDAEIEALRATVAELEALVAATRDEKNAFLAGYAAALLHETDRLFAHRQDAFVRHLGEAFSHGSTLRVFFVHSLGAVVCAGSVEQCLFAARALQSACVTTLSLGKLARGADESDGAADVADAEDDTVTIRSEDGDQLRVRSYEMEFEVLARELDAAGAQTGYTYRLPPLRDAHRTERRPAELSEIEIPPVPFRLASSPTGDSDFDEFGTPQATSKARVEYRVTPNVYRREEKDVPGSSRKLVRWVSERGSDRSAISTIYRLDTPHATFAPPGDVRSLIANRTRVRDAYYNDTVSAGPQSRFEDETEWDEAARRKEAVLSGRVDSTLVVGAASRGVLSKDALEAGSVATVYYAPNPFQQPTAADRELRRYLKAQHVHLPTDTHFLDERAEEEQEEEDDHHPATPKRRASASAITTTTPVPIALNSVAAAAAQRATEISERRRQSGQPQEAAPAPVAATPSTSNATPAATTVKVTATPVAATPTVSASASVSPPSLSLPQQPPQPPPHATGTVQVGVAASASEPIRLTVASSSKSKTLPAGVTQEQIEAAGAEEKKEKKKGLKGLFSKKDKKK